MKSHDNENYEKKISFKHDEDEYILILLEKFQSNIEKICLEKNPDEIRKDISKLVTDLKKAFNGVLKTTNAVHEDIVGANDATAETAEDADKIRATLEQLTEGRFLSVEAMNEALKGLRGVKVEIPADEIARLNGLFPTELSQEVLGKMEKAKDKTEGEKGSLVMQLPAKVMVDGQEKPFTIAVMEEIMRKASNADSSLKPLWFSYYVSEDVKNKIWDSALTVWTSACLKESKGKNYQDQLRHQAEILGAEYRIEADMILAMALRYISGKEELMLQDFMRLNTLGTNNKPLAVYVSDRRFPVPCCDKTTTDDSHNFYVNEDSFVLDSSRSCGRSIGGIGASFRISS